MEESNTRVFFFVKSLLSLEESRGGYHEHVYGVNLGYVRKHGGLIYSLDNGTVYKDLDPVKKQGIIPLILGIFFRYLISGDAIVLVFIYPSIMRVSYIIPILVLTRLTSNIKTIIDLHDLYKEQKEAFDGKPIGASTYLVRFIDKMFLNYISDKIFIPSKSLKSYIRELYNIKPEKLVYYPNSSFIREITPSKPPEVFTILYSGSLMIEKGIPSLIDIVKQLHSEDYDVNLILLGMPLMELPQGLDWLTVAYLNFPEIQSYYNKTSVCIISFKKHLYFEMAAPIKLFDYMAAGKPVISNNLSEISRIINETQCGFIIKNSEDLLKIIKKLYNDPETLEKIGMNGRTAIENEYNWSKRVDQLKTVIDQLYQS